MIPQILEGGIAVDDRGRLLFANTFDLSPYKRFYIISNHKRGYVRAWHGHKIESKAFFMLQGSALLAAVKIDNWETPDPESVVSRFVLSNERPSLLLVPPGYANGSMMLTEGAQLLVFSSLPISDAALDDFRFPARYWNAWEIEER